MMTYKKPVGAADSFLRPSRTYHDFELESGINKKVNCLIAFAAVALIVALAALSLAIMLLLQAFQTAEVETNKLALLQQRIKHLEEQIEQNGSNVKILLPTNLNPPIVIDGKSGSNDTPEHRATKDAASSETHIEGPEDPEQESNDGNQGLKEESNERTQGPPMKSITPEDASADDEKDGTDGCISFPPPSCPVGYTLRNTEGPCPRLVCHPGDDDEDYDGSGEECPNYPQPVCPMGYVAMPSDDPCPRPVCRKPLPEGLK
ncbi:uncharacterized protein [Palaemon carinicauda]|uniref:uncharacterized protein n=1 Tax=Palaemon carinicauda TaxID=392227 RepID=UPI0035B6A92F